MAKLDWTGWSEWRPLGMDDGMDLVLVPTRPGSYAISAGKPITRILDVDMAGILLIGESDNLRKRLSRFADCSITPGASSHEGGRRYALLQFTKHYPYHELLYRWKETETKADAYKLEGKMQFEYLKTHLELPPLNFQLNQSSFKITGADILNEYLAEAAKQLPPPE